MNTSCKQCSKDFIIDNEDQNFYQKMNVPYPTHCPSCRAQRRLAFRNDRALFKRKKKPIYPCHRVVIIIRGFLFFFLPKNAEECLSSENMWQD